MKKEETKRCWKTVTIEEFYKKTDDGVVDWYWKFPNEKHWRSEATAYKELPWVEADVSQEQKILDEHRRMIEEKNRSTIARPFFVTKQPTKE